MSDADGWIEWKGGEYPVPIGIFGELQLRCGAILKRDSRDLADASWEHTHLGGDIIAYRVVEPAHPTVEDRASLLQDRIHEDSGRVRVQAAGRRHISEAAEKSFLDSLSAWDDLEDSEFVAQRHGLVVLTVAEHDELLAMLDRAQKHAFETGDIAIRANGEASVLRAEVALLTKERDAAIAAANATIDELNRLRKGSDDVSARVAGLASVSDGASQGTAQALLAVDPSQSQDPRLGLPQPDGEPVEPMSGRKPYRWGRL